MITTRLARLRAAFIAVLVLPLAACAADPASPSAAPSEPAPVTATPAAEPADPLEEVVSITVRPGALELHDAKGGIVAEVDLMGEATEAVTVLSTAFDVEPVSGPYEGDAHFPGGTTHRWDGFTLWETNYDEEQRIAADLDNLLWPRLVAVAEVPEVGGVEIESVLGRVGDRVDELAGPVDPEVWTCGGWAAETVEVVRAGGTTGVVGVGVTFSGAIGWRETPPAADETVTALRAPTDVATGCV
jgi:hypothetical protein